VKEFYKNDPLENSRQRRWWLFCTQFRLSIAHIPSCKNELPDLLSRESFNEKYSVDIDSLARCAFAKLDVQLDLRLESLPEDFPVPSPSDSDEDLTFSSIWNSLMCHESTCSENDGKMYYKSVDSLFCERKRALPVSCLSRVVSRIHKLFAHPGPDKTVYFLLKEFSVPLKISDLRLQVKNLLSSCRVCAENKPPGISDIGLVGALPIPHLVNDLIYLDFRVMDGFGGFDYLLVVMDGLSRFVQLFPVSKHISGEQVLSLLFSRWIQPFGLPGEIHSDNDVRFASSKGVYQSVLRALGCRCSFSSPRHPQGNSMVERMNRTVLQVFRILMSQLHSKNWPLLAPYVAFCINSYVHKVSGFSPGELFLGRPFSFFRFSI
jgi:transposase InsO family protein